MALILFDGLDTYESKAAFISRGYSPGYADWYSFNTTGGRFGTTSVDGAWNNETCLQMIFPQGYVDMWHGHAAYVTEANINAQLKRITNAAIADANANCINFYVAQGYLGVTKGSSYWTSNTVPLVNSSSAVIKKNSWHYIEYYVKLDGVGGHIEAWVDNVKVIDYTGNTLINHGNTTIQSNTLVRGVTLSNQNTYNDDWYMLDTTGTSANSRLGDLRIMALPVDGDAGPNDGANTVQGWSSVNKTANVSLSNNNLTLSVTYGGNADWNHPSNYIKTGKAYFEVTVVSGAPEEYIGFKTKTSKHATDQYILVNPSNYYMLRRNSLNLYQLTYYNYNDANNKVVTANDVICYAIDVDNGLAWVRVNGREWNKSNTANPATGVGGISYKAGMVAPVLWNVYGDIVRNLNLGSAAFAQTIPSGFSSFNSLDTQNHYKMVNEFPVNYDQEGLTIPNGSGNSEIFTVTNLPSNANQVFAVSVVTKMNKTDSGQANAKLVIVSNNTSYNTASIPISTSSTQYRQDYAVNPNTDVAWTVSEVNASKIGIVVE